MRATHTGVAIRLLAISCLSAYATAALAEVLPQHWLDRMAVAVQTTSYEGTVIRVKDGTAEALKVAHTVEDGVIREKVVAQEGDGLEIIRIGNEVHCILPDRKSVLVEEWNNQSTLFSTLPNSNIRFGNEYDLVFMGTERVAGREATRIAIRPHDAFRYAHQIWLDTETGFPLQTQLINEGVAIEQVKFAEIALNHDIHASALEPSYSTEGFTWLQQTSGHAGTAIETSWASDELPAGFKAVSTHEEVMSGSDEVVTHILFSDGLANVSVFIAASSGELAAGPAQVGGSNSFSVVRGEFEITAIGEVPAITVKQIATTMRPL
ncbi:MAG: MucB/RseB C-terminal domain-containing protein [Gammaproteobacteria bacterium]|nr:MucB/RseB C-terminal domain-containing protein [Gammaproteobacteria bacterium]